MTTYSTITNGQVDQDSPITQPLVTALRDNPIAIAEGAAGAPKIADSWQALETTSSSGLIVTDVDNGEGARINVGGSGQASSGQTLDFKVSISSDNGSNFTGETTLATVTAPSGPGEFADLTPEGLFVFDRPTGAWAFLNGADVITGTFASSSGTTDIRFRFLVGSTAQTDKIAALAFLTGGKATT